MSNVASVINYFATANEGFISTTGGTVASGAVNVPLNTTSGLVDSSVFVGIIEPGTVNQQTFTGSVDLANSRITGVKWTRGSNTDHVAGATVVDYITGTAWNMLVTGLLKEHHQSGHHSNITADSVATTTLTINGVDSSQLTPAGMMAPFAGSSAPTGWLICDGSSVLRASYASLFAAIGTTYGSADGTHFTLPDSRGKVLVGLNSSGTFVTLGGTGGEETHTLTTGEMPVHSHGVNDPGHAHTIRGHIEAQTGGPGRTASDSSINNTSTVSSGTGISIQDAGSGGAHNNLQPYLTINHIIKT